MSQPIKLKSFVMDNLFEIGDLGVLRDIPAELTQLQSANNVLRTQLHRQINISNVLKVCLIATIVIIVIKATPLNKRRNDADIDFSDIGK